MILKNLTNNYSTIPNELITDSSISPGAFRLYCYLASKPETWEINNTDIMKNLKIGSNNSLAKYWKELISSGWVEKQKEKDKSGKFTGKTILILHNTRNRKSCENGDLPNSQDNRNRKSCEIAKSAMHNNTDINSNTEYSSNTEEYIYSTLKEFLADTQIQTLINDLKVDEEFVKDLWMYRLEIQEPIKSKHGLKGLLKDILTTHLKSRIPVAELVEMMKEKEWKTITPNYLPKPKSQSNYSKKESNYEDLKKFGFTYDETEILIEEVRDEQN